MRLFVVRHAETVYNADARMQGPDTHTPLTRRGVAQAEAMGATLAAALGSRPDLDIWASPAGRTLQTAAVVAEHLGVGYFDIRVDARLLEIDVGEWRGRRYADVEAGCGPIVDPVRRLFTVRPPGGDWYPDIAARLGEWLRDLRPDRDALAVTHGVTSRVLRGLLGGGAPFEGVALADAVPQGAIVEVADGIERLIPGGGRTPPEEPPR